MAAHKRSKKRDIVLDVLKSTKGHPSAQWVYLEARKFAPDISLGTVYRNLGMFKDEGTISSVGVVDGEERYDFNVMPHTHFVCVQCKKVIDIDDKNICVNDKIEQHYGVKVESRAVVYNGLCCECSESAKALKSASGS